MSELRFRLGERRSVAHRGEQLARLIERRFGTRPGECDEAAALAEERVGVLGDVAELLPANGRLRVEVCRFGMVAGVFGELGAGGANRVLA